MITNKFSDIKPPKIVYAIEADIEALKAENERLTALNAELAAALEPTLSWFDWIDGNSVWLIAAIAKEYSASKADEFALRAFSSRKTREDIRAALTKVKK